jgi:hypothetical protein
VTAMYRCPKCGNRHMAWDARAGQYLCLGVHCSASCPPATRGIDVQGWIDLNTITAEERPPTEATPEK